MPTSNSWEPVTGSFPGYYRTAAALLADGARVLLTGGSHDPAHGGGCRQAWRYDGAQIVQLAEAMIQPRFGHTATTLGNGKVLLAGSEALDATAGRAAGTAELYDPALGQFAATGNLAEPRGWHTATWLPSCGKVLIAGGEDPALRLNGVVSPKTSAELYDPATGVFRKTSHPLNAARSGHTATLLQDNTVLIVGGYSTAARGSAEIYNPATETFTPIAGPSIGRFDHAATLLHDGRVLIAGGYENGGGTTGHEEIFNPISKLFTEVAPIQKTAYGLTLTTLANGKVLAVGGSANGERIPDLTIDPYWWIFDPTPAIPTFTKMPVTTQRIAFHTATLLASGCVFVAGGAGIGNQFPGNGMLYWPDLVTLRLNFQGGGAGSVTGHPARIACTGNAVFQVPAGIQLFLFAQAAAPWMSTGWEMAPGAPGPIGAYRPQRWTKVMVLHTNVFDGWGKLAPFDAANPLVLVMNTNRSPVVNFGAHTSTAPWPGPRILPAIQRSPSGITPPALPAHERGSRP